MAGQNNGEMVRCGYPLRDNSPCQAGARLNGRCEHHSALEIGALNGWQVSGSRKAGVYKAEKGERRLFASSAKEMYELLQRKVPQAA